jgi:malonyl-CoA O-methyltransferase
VNRVVKARVRAAFSRGAAGYDGAAAVQALVRARVATLAAEVAPEAGRLLDVGAGTGRLLADLLATRPALQAAGVDLAPGMCAATRRAAPAAAVAAADAEALPFGAGRFDLAISTSTFQWLPRLEPALAECARVLRPGGALVLALFADQTLRELRTAWREAAGPRAGERLHRFFTAAEVAAALEGAGFGAIRIEEALHVEHHPDPAALLRSLKRIGAQGATPGPGGLGGRRVLLEALERYRLAVGGPNGVPASWHVVYAVASR